MQNFQQILTQAAQLKQHQLKKDRKGYQSLPQFLKSGLGYNKKYELVRKQHFHFQFRVSNKVKECGNILFKENKVEEALSNYEEALAIFRYIQSTTYQNMKDENLSYHFYEENGLPTPLKQKYHSHLCALYLNICSCLTKLNKKEDALFSADQALKIKKTAKGHYKKAQAYLRYVNRDANDIKLGILELKQAYSIEKDPGLINEMSSAKQSYQKQQEKSKNWFKFMFDKNKKADQQTKSQAAQPEAPKEDPKQKIKEEADKQQQLRKKQLAELQRSTQAEQGDEGQKFEQTKQKLRSYLGYGDSEWEEVYQKQFMRRNGSKIYSILKIYKYEDLASEFRTLFAKCLQNEEKSTKSCQQCIQWIKSHPVQQIKKYGQRYDLQTSWIRQNRIKNQDMSRVAEKSEVAGEERAVREEDLEVFKQQKSDQSLSNSSMNTNSTLYDENKAEKSMQKVRRNEEQSREQVEQTKVGLSKEEKKKYITVAIVLFLMLVRFLWD